MAAYVRGHQFHRRVMCPALELASYSEDVTETEFAGRRAFKVTGHTHIGAVLSYFFDERSKTVLGLQLTVEEPEGPHAMEFVLKDWRTVGGSELFYRVDIRDRDELYIYRFNKILLLP